MRKEACDLGKKFVEKSDTPAAKKCLDRAASKDLIKACKKNAENTASLNAREVVAAQKVCDTPKK